MTQSNAGGRKSVSARAMAEKKAEHAKAVEIKEKVVALEEGNRKNLILFKSTGNWYKMGGNSALFYYYDIAPRVGVSPKLQSDRDYYSKFEHGVISIRDIKAFGVKMSLIDVRLDKKQTEGEDIIVYTLPNTYTEEEIARLMNVEKVKHDQFNAIVKVVNCRPKYYTDLRIATKKIYEFVRKSEPILRGTLGKDLFNNMRAANVSYLSYTRGAEDIETHFRSSAKNIKDALNVVTILMEIEVMPLDFAIEIANSLTGLLDNLRKSYVQEKDKLMRQKARQEKEKKNKEQEESYDAAVERAKGHTS